MDSTQIGTFDGRRGRGGGTAAAAIGSHSGEEEEEEGLSIRERSRIPSSWSGEPIASSAAASTRKWWWRGGWREKEYSGDVFFFFLVFSGLFASLLGSIAKAKSTIIR